MRLRRRIGTAIALVALAATTVVAVPAPAAVAHSGHYTPAAFRAWATGKYLGPTAATRYQRDRITSWHVEHPVSVMVDTWVPTIATHQYPDPNAVRALDAPSADGGTFSHHWSWPWNWDWSSIFGKVWAMFKDCLSGARDGLIPAVSGTVAVNMIFRGGKVFVGPYGYAAIALGGCVAAIVG